MPVLYCKDEMFVSPFSVEKHVKLFRRALLLTGGNREGLRLLAPSASTRSICRGLVLLWIYIIVLRVLHVHVISNPNISGPTLRVQSMSAVYFAVVRLLFGIVDICQL